MEFDMVFEGGGAKGMAFVGALKALEAHGHTHRRLIGTSAGAITATLLTVGYDAKKMEQELGRQDNGKPVFAKFMDAPTAADFTAEDIENSITMKLFGELDLDFGIGALENLGGKIDKRIIKALMKLRAYPTLFSFLERGGLYAGNVFLTWLTERLNEQQPGLAGMTLEQLHNKTGKDLSLVATDTTAHEMLILNHRTTPKCPVVWAVRMSMSIPFAWQEVRWQPSWGSYRLMNTSGTTIEKEFDLTGHAIVDGGVLSNFPITLLTSFQPSIMGGTPPEPQKVLGLLIDETLVVNGAPPPPKESVNDNEGLRGDLKKLRTVNRVSRLLDTMMDAHDKQAIATHSQCVCFLPAKTYGTMEFDMTEARKKALVSAAEQTTKLHLQGRGL
jgi:predicted acylesterase/phospholipase RssA